MKLRYSLFILGVGYASAGQLSGLNANFHQAHGKYFGTATDPRYFNDTRYVDIINNTAEWGSTTTENSLKWEALRPSKDTYDFTTGDEIVNWSISKGYLVRCHTLSWYRGLPNWLSEGTWTKETLLAVLEEHIETVVTHFRGRCHSWDVVNEAIDDDGTLRSTIWMDIIGPEYLDRAFAIASQADPNAKLYYNDYGIESINVKSQAVAELVSGLLERGAPIDAVGFQAHIPEPQPPTYSDLVASFSQFTSLGLEVAITELDVFVQLPNDDAKTSHQSKIYTDLVKACVDTALCEGVTVWGFSDAVSWVYEGVPGYGDPHLWAADYTKKPVYFAVEAVVAS